MTLIDSTSVGDAGRFRTLAELERMVDTLPGSHKDEVMSLC